MDIKDLIVFKAVADEGAISRAAQKMNYVQSTVTMRIQHLESELGTPLFYRNGKGVDLNANGKTLLPYVEQMLKLMDQSIAAVQERNGSPSGTLRIGSTESTAAVRLPPLLAAYCQAFPEVDLILETHTTADLIRLVRERKLDGAFVAGDVHHSELTARLFREEALTLIGSRPLDSITELSQSNLLVFSHGCYYRNRLEKWLHEEGIYPRRILEFGTVEAIIGCVKAGMGMAIMIEAILKKQDPGLVRIPLPDKYATVPTYFITKKDSEASAALHEFAKIIGTGGGDTPE